MSKDRDELSDLAASMPAKVKEMSDMWNAWAIRCHVYPAPGQQMNEHAGAGEFRLGD
jgi:hypothetical protein